MSRDFFSRTTPLAIVLLRVVMIHLTRGSLSFARIASLLALMLCSAAAEQAANPGTQPVILGWDASPDPTVAGYHLYVGTASGLYSQEIDVGTNTQYTVTGLVAGSTYYFSATSYDASGIESSYVPEVSYLVPGLLTLTPDRVGNVMRIQFPVAPPQTCQLQVSSDLQTWSTLWLTPPQTSNGWIEYDDPTTSALPARFYRLIFH